MGLTQETRHIYTNCRDHYRPQSLMVENGTWPISETLCYRYVVGRFQRQQKVQDDNMKTLLLRFANDDGGVTEQEQAV